MNNINIIGLVDMKKSRRYLFSGFVAFLMISVFCIGINANSSNTPFKTNNEEIYLGYASIWGNGTSSVLDASVENNLLIKISSKSEIVDFYINYDMNCESLTDEGIITLALSLDNENISVNITQTPTQKTGSLYLHDVEVNRGESLILSINVAYGNLITLYHNETSALGAAIVPKSKLSTILFERFPILYNLFQAYF